jgi:hypothetical protein
MALKCTPMTWIKQANKIGKYRSTYKGFRIYCTKQSRIVVRIEKREDGLYRITQIIPGWLVAVDKTGSRFEGADITSVAFKIDIEILNRHFDKIENKSL